MLARKIRLISYVSLVFWSVWLLPAQAQYAVAPEVFQAAPAAKRAVQLKSTQPFAQARGLANKTARVELAAPTTSELQQLSEQASDHKAYQVGISRTLTTVPAFKNWQWRSVAGGQVAHVEVSSPQAHRLRLQLKAANALAQGVELRFYVPSTQQVYGVFKAADFRELADKTWQLWSPSVPGETIGLEMFLPAGVAPETVTLQLPRVSHIAYDFDATGSALAGAQAKAPSCNVSIACAPQRWQETAKAVAQYLYIADNGASFMCTGTLLADQDTSSQIPYMLSAAHCLQDQAAADTAEFYWFYRPSTCQSQEATYQVTSGGADLLARQAAVDGAFFKLRSSPPNGVVLAGWDLSRLQPETPVTALHHVVSEPKYFSQGRVKQFVETIAPPVDGAYEVSPDPRGDFAQVVWNSGITQAGSSGSGLWIERDGVAYLKGTVMGGQSRCTTPNLPDDYARLERFYPALRPWLATQASQLHSVTQRDAQPLALLDGVVIARYMRGERGAALLQGIAETEAWDVFEVEQHLWEMQPFYDIDADGEVSSTRDGLLLIRYLLGLRGEALVKGLGLQGAERAEPADIATYLKTALSL